MLGIFVELKNKKFNLFLLVAYITYLFSSRYLYCKKNYVDYDAMLILKTKIWREHLISLLIDFGCDTSCSTHPEPKCKVYYEKLIIADFFETENFYSEELAYIETIKYLSKHKVGNLFFTDRIILFFYHKFFIKKEGK